MKKDSMCILTRKKREYQAGRRSEKKMVFSLKGWSRISFPKKRRNTKSSRSPCCERKNNAAAFFLFAERRLGPTCYFIGGGGGKEKESGALRFFEGGKGEERGGGADPGRKEPLILREGLRSRGRGFGWGERGEKERNW